MRLSRNHAVQPKGGTGNLPVLAGSQPASIARHGHCLVRLNQLPFRAASCRTEQASCLCYPTPTASFRLRQDVSTGGMLRSVTFYALSVTPQHHSDEPPVL